MRLPPRAIRRLCLPVYVVLFVLVLALLLLGALLGLLSYPFFDRRPLRLAVFGLTYWAVEILVLFRGGVAWLQEALKRVGRRPDPAEWTEYHRRLLDWALGVILESARRSLGFRVVVNDNAGAGLLDGEAPVMVLARHGGPGDSFALVHLLLSRYDRGVRVVLKDVLQLDPALDLVLNRLGCCFLSTGSASTEELADKVSRAVHELGPRGTLLLFPEGANWSPERRHRAIRRLRRERRHRAARAADLMDHVLPPRPAGVLACLGRRPGIPVVIAAHTGLDHVVRPGQAWRALHRMSETPMTVRLWAAAPVPDSEEERLAWLTAEWAVVDEWIDAQR